MHQLMRLLYCDQMTPVDQIFRLDERYDTKDLRSAVSELLLGFDDLALHDLRMQMRDTDRKYGVVVGELQSVFRLLGKTSDSDVAAFDFNNEMASAMSERASVVQRVEEISRTRDVNARKEASSKAVEISERLRLVNSELEEGSHRLQNLRLESEDSREFLRTLSERITALDASTGMEEYLGMVSFPYCPVCMTPVTENGSEGACHLCKSHIGQGPTNVGRLKMREELTFQHRESSQILQRKLTELDALSSKLADMNSRREALVGQVAEFRNRTDPLDAEIASLQQRVGYLSRSVEDLKRKAELSDIVKERMRERERLSSDLESLRTRVESLESARVTRRERVRYRIVELCVEALRADLPLEETFRNAELVQFDFALNKISVDGRTRFSASSSTYLKNAFLFSLFQLSLEDPEVRWPRFILLDNIEDKGMQPARSANFQEFVVRKSNEATTQHQIIVTTSMIAPGLEDSALCIGPHYLPGSKSLRFVHGEAATK
jgi:predicted  nucleic acid-binding Zn-ribbon protein